MATAVREEIVEEVTLGPNSLPQRQFLSSRAQIAVCGGSAGGGKTFSAFLDVLPFMQGNLDRPDAPYVAPQPGYSAVFFRRTVPEITNEGGMWDSSREVFRHFPHAEPIAGNLEWRWPIYKGLQCTIRMTHLQHVWTVQNWDGAQVPYFYFDQLEHFEGSQFWYMQSRNRSMTGVPGLMRAGCNPDPDSFVADLISWYIDQREKIIIGGKEVPNPAWGFPIPERAGVVRYFFRDGDTIHWGNSRRELRHLLPARLPDGITPRHLIKSFTFIPFKVTDNKDLMKRDPSYYGNLLSLDYVERERKLGGNWKIRPEAGKVFPKEKARLIPTRPTRIRTIVRYWDKAASEKKGSDWTVGTLMAILEDNGRPVVLDVVRGQWATAQREKMIRDTAMLDGVGVPVVIEEEGGSGGKDSSWFTITQTLAGFDVRTDRPTGDLFARSRPLQAQWQVENVDVVTAGWTKAFLDELHNYDGKPSTATKKDDQVASASGAYNWLQVYGAQSFDARNWATLRG